MVHSRSIEEYKRSLSLTTVQREVVVGLLLGDGCLETQNGGRTFRLKLAQSEEHKPYLLHLYGIFDEWVRTPPRPKQIKAFGSEYTSWGFQTYSHPAFRFYAQQFYEDRRKRVPRLIHKWLTPRSLAYWFMDDGSMKSAESKGVIFNTQGFETRDVERLASVLGDSFGLDSKLRKQKEGPQIYVSGRSYETFIELVKPFVIDEMYYKLPGRRTQLPKR